MKRMSQLHDIRAIPANFSEFQESRSGMVAHLQPGDALYLPFMWWHYVEHVRNTPRPISFSISWYPDAINDIDHGFKNTHSRKRNKYDSQRQRVFMDDAITNELARQFGPEDTVKYFRMVGKGAFLTGVQRAAMESASNASVPVPSARSQTIHDAVFPEITAQVGHRKFLKPNETVMDYMMEIASFGRFEFPLKSEHTKKSNPKKKKKAKRNNKKKATGTHGSDTHNVERESISSDFKDEL